MRPYVHDATIIYFEGDELVSLLHQVGEYINQHGLGTSSKFLDMLVNYDPERHEFQVTMYVLPTKGVE